MVVLGPVLLGMVFGEVLWEVVMLRVLLLGVLVPMDSAVGYGGAGVGAVKGV